MFAIICLLLYCVHMSYLSRLNNVLPISLLPFLVSPLVIPAVSAHVLWGSYLLALRLQDKMWLSCCYPFIISPPLSAHLCQFYSYFYFAKAEYIHILFRSLHLSTERLILKSENQQFPTEPFGGLRYTVISASWTLSPLARRWRVLVFMCIHEYICARMHACVCIKNFNLGDFFSLRVSIYFFLHS